MLHSLFVAPNWDLYVVFVLIWSRSMLPIVDNCWLDKTIALRRTSTEATVTLQRPQKRHLALGIEDSNASLICDSGEATTNKHLALSAEGGWKMCWRFVSQLRQRWTAPCARRWRWTEDIQLDQLEVYCNFHSESEPMLFFPDRQII